MRVDTNGAQCVDERGQRPVALAANLGLRSVDLDGGLDDVRAAVGFRSDHPLADALQRPDRRQVLVGEGVPHLLAGDLATLTVGDLLDHLAELDLQTPRQHQSVVGLHDVGHPALTGLGVHPDHGLVGAADILGVDGQIRHLPEDVLDIGVSLVRGDFHRVQALVDGVLMAAGERRVHQVSAVGVPLGHRQLIAVLDGASDLVDVGEVDLRVHPAGEQVQAQGHQADVAGALAVAEQAALDPVGTGLETQFGCGDSGSAVVVGVQAQDDRIPSRQVAAHPLDRVGVDVRGGHLHGRGQVDDQRPLRGGLQYVAHRVTDLQGVLQLGARVGLRRVLVTPPGAGVFGLFFQALPGAVGGDLLDLVAVGPEDHPPLQDRGGVVEVHDHVRRAVAGLEGPLDQLRSALGQHLDGDVVGNRALLDDFANEVEIGLAGRREANLDLLVAHLHQQVEHTSFASRTHGVDQRLVAVTKIHRAPRRRLLDDTVRPGAVERSDGSTPGDFSGEGPVPIHRHRGVALGVPRRLAGSARAGRLVDGAGGYIGVDRSRVEMTVHDIAPGSGGGGLRPAHREHPRREASLDQTPSRRPRRSTRCTLKTVLRLPQQAQSCG